MKNKNEKQTLNTTLIKSTNQFPVVGIGASAGGLDAFKKLLKAIPENSGMAYVLVQHLDPKHDSLLPELLQKVTSIPVVEITDEIKVLANHIYIIPSNKMLIANDGVLQLSQRPDKTKNQRNLPIDLFFASLAEIHEEYAIGVVLSGTASDGTQGLRAIKEHGGITFAQDQNSAAYEGMPQSAVQAGVVDFILPPEKMPEKIIEMMDAINANGSEKETGEQNEEVIFKKIITLLRIKKTTDFTFYKQTTIRRRILRRMALTKFENTKPYLKFLETNKAEQDLLYQDLLIPVTSFFRDPAVFDTFCETVLPILVKNKAKTEPIRGWVAGCSTGQEAYSIAICLKEYLTVNGLENEGKNPQIFATDLSGAAIAKARMAVYTKTEVEGVSAERLQEYFLKTTAGYQVNKSIRDMCVFAVHNFLKDPPFGKIDFASCRNVLIYMEPYLQKKAMTMFHYALNPKGYLLLGKSETSSTVPDLFTLFAKNEKLFIRKDAPAKFMHVASQRIEQTLNLNSIKSTNEKMLTDFKKAADELMLSKYTPAGVVVNDGYDIVHFRGNTSQYLEQTAGKPTHNLLQLAKIGLAFELRNILHKVKKQNSAVIKPNIPLVINGVQKIIVIEAIPLPNMVEPHFLILFNDNQFEGSNKATIRGKIATKKPKGDEKDLQIQQLEIEIAQTREDMRGITEDQEAANEELQSANEELLSSSEELQSLNEELETSKEELQSTNEELTVLNQELNSLNDVITEASNYSESIVATLREPLLILDQHLRVKSANDSFYKIFKVNSDTTEGVLIFDLGNKQWNIPALRTLLFEILPQKTSFKDFEITHHFPTIGERIMLLNARELVREKTAEKLILLAIEDITEQVQARKKIEESESFNRTILENSPDCIKILDTDGRLNYMNKNGQCLMEIDDFELYENKYWWDLWNDENKPLVKKAIAKAKKGEKTQMQMLGNTTKGNPKWWDIIVSPMQVLDNKKKQPQIISISRDITEQKNQQLKEKELLNRFQSLVLQAPVAICVLRGENYVIELINERMADMWDRKREEIINRPAFDVLAELRDQGFKELLDHVYTTGERFVAEELPISLKRNGTLENAFVKFIYEPLREADGSITGVMALAHEITEQVLGRKKMEVQALLHENMLMTSPGFVCTMVGPTYIYDLVNDRYQKIFGTRKLKGKAMLDAIPELKGQGIDTLLHKVYTTGETYVGNDMPITISRDENAAPVLCYFNFSYQPMYNEQNEIFSILVFGYEVTEQVIARNLIFEIEQKHSKELEESVRLRTIELTNANQLLLQRNKEIEKQGARLIILNKELNFQNIEKEKRAAELLTANKELLFQNQEKQKREAELFIANKELIFQNDEKAKTATKLNIANTELQAFNYISSHDLQEPLRKIQTFASRILDDEYETLTEKGKNSFQRMQNAAERMRILIDDLIAFSKLQPDERKFEKTDLTKIVSVVISDLKEVIDENKATVVTKTLCDVNIIPFQFYQLFYNLLSNAIKFSKPDVASHIVISSTVEKGKKLKNEQLIPDQNYCHISITDNGIGFDPEFSERIFGVFQKLHGKDEYEGSGIGLAIVKKIVDNHKGIVLASSELNKGAKFDIYIPAD